MTDPKRWIDDGAPDPVRELLIAAREEQPRRVSAQRTLVALGVGSALSAGAESAAGAAAAKGGTSVAAAAKGASGALGLTVKWGLVGAATAVVVGVAGASVRHAAHAPAPPALSATARASDGSPRVGDLATAGVAPAGPAQPSPASPALADDEPAAAAPARAGAAALVRPSLQKAPATRAPGSANAATGEVAASKATSRASEEESPGVQDVAVREETSVMLEEVAAIDQARAAVARGDAAAAITFLNAYAARFKAPKFEPEALYLRMEALGLSGDREGQRRVAERLLDAFPIAPQSARARALLR